MPVERAPRHRWLAAVGVAVYVAGVLVQFLVPTAAPWDGTLIGTGIAVLLVTYPDGRVRQT